MEAICRTRPGQSGSPVIAYKKHQYKDTQGNLNIDSGGKTEFLGVYTVRINKESDLGYTWKLSAIKQLIDKINIKS